MSFTTEIKNEICSNDYSKLENICLLSGFIRNNAIIEDNEIIILSENLKVVRKVFSLFKELFDVSPSYSQIKGNNLSKKSYYNIYIDDKLNLILSSLMYYDEEDNVLKVPSEYFLDGDDLKRAYLRGAFLAGGSVSSPEKAYQLEIACTTENNAERLTEILSSLHLESKSIKRKNRFIVYIKDGDTISDFLGMTGGMNSLMEFENIRVLKEMRNSINRTVNCDTANINKVVNAASKQIDDIKLIEERRGLDSLPEQLKTVAEMRLLNPHLSLAELGERLSPPLGKSGVNHRLAKISKIADSMR